MKKDRKFMQISIDKLTSGLAYQRKIDEDFVADKVKNFDFYQVNPICVSLRDGNYNVVDGQHTIAILKAKGYKNAYCEIRYGLTFEDENKWFYNKETNGRKQNSSAKLNARYLSKDDNTLNDLIVYLAIVGYKLKLVEVKSSDGVINAADTIEKIFVNMSRADFTKYITLHNATWSGNKKSLQAPFLKGFEMFYSTYKDKIDEQRFIKVFNLTMSKKAKSPDELKGEADRDIDTKDVAMSIAKVFVRNYNKGLGNDKKLKLSWLED